MSKKLLTREWLDKVVENKKLGEMFAYPDLFKVQVQIDSEEPSIWVWYLVEIEQWQTLSTISSFPELLIEKLKALAEFLFKEYFSDCKFPMTKAEIDEFKVDVDEITQKLLSEGITAEITKKIVSDLADADHYSIKIKVSCADEQELSKKLDVLVNRFLVLKYGLNINPQEHRLSEDEDLYESLKEIGFDVEEHTTLEEIRTTFFLFYPKFHRLASTRALKDVKKRITLPPRFKGRLRRYLIARTQILNELFTNEMIEVTSDEFVVPSVSFEEIESYLRRRIKKEPRLIKCEYCGTEIYVLNPKQRYCSSSCRVLQHRKKKVKGGVNPP